MELPAGSWVLRPWREGDEPALAKYANNRNVWINLRGTFPHPYTMEDAAAWVQAQKDRDPQTEFAIANADEAIGAIGLRMHGDEGGQSAEIGYWLGEPFWGQGIATEAVRALIVYALEHFDPVRVQATVFEWNPASIRVLEKCGFAFEERLPWTDTKDGQTVDQLLYVLVRE